MLDEHKIHELGQELVKTLPDGFHGNVQFNIYDGSYVNASTQQFFKPEKPRKEAKK
jgi:hypothetical protein